MQLEVVPARIALTHFVSNSATCLASPSASTRSHLSSVLVVCSVSLVVPCVGALCCFRLARGLLFSACAWPPLCVSGAASAGAPSLSVSVLNPGLLCSDLCFVLSLVSSACHGRQHH